MIVAAVLVSALLAGCGSPTRTLPQPRMSSSNDVAETPAKAVAVKPPPPAKDVVSNPNPTPPAAATAKAAVDPTAATATESPAPATSAVVSPTPAAPRPLELPADFAKWDQAAFIHAKQTRSPQLMPAVNSLVQRQSENPQKAAEILTALLGPTAPPASTEQGEEDDGSAVFTTTVRRPPAATASSQSPDALCKIVTVALVQNSSDRAGEAIKQILMGQLVSDFSDELLITETLTALAALQSPRSDNFLLTVLTMADQVRRPGRGTITAEELQSQAIAVAGPRASPNLRKLVAEHLSDPSTASETRMRLYKLAAAPSTENAAALAQLYKAGITDPWKETALEPVLAQASAQALNLILGVATGAAPTKAAIPDQPLADDEGEDPFAKYTTTRRRPAASKHANGQLATIDLETGLLVASHLWQSDFIAEAARRCSGLRAPLDRENPLLALAMSLPSNRLRAAQSALWHRYWDGGPQQFGLDGAQASTIGDPALLAVMKKIPRAEPYAPKKLGGRKETSSKDRDELPANAQLEREAKAKQAWLESSFELVKALNARFQQAASNKTTNQATVSLTAATTGPSAANPVNKLPLELNSGAEVTDEYHIDLQATVSSQLSGLAVDDLVVHYVRAECRDEPREVLDHYSRKLRAAEKRGTKDAWWLDASIEDKASRRLRSVDVLVKSEVEKTPATFNTSQQLVVEILWIECSTDAIASSQ